ncbi:MAG: SUMF1/EgtB/PvdO family nonheme iron enzyme [Planctomycetota bacterium]|nr:SUMF1/EgtB/PvdO family nonheme iron enzyme [Planctomycetota bacterium]
MAASCNPGRLVRTPIQSSKTDMGDKPVNYVSWFDAARVSNWYQNGATSSSSTETGAYTLVGGQTTGTAPAVNPGATFYVPTEDQWYKAAYYKGGGTSAGYWNYATQSDSAPTTVTAGLTGIGSAGSTGNFANYNSGADWNSQDGNVTTVGTNGGPSFYGAFDMSGNVTEWNDLTGAAGSSRGLRGGHWGSGGAVIVSSSSSGSIGPSDGNNGIGFRLANRPERFECRVGFDRRWTGTPGTTAVRPLTVPFGVDPSGKDARGHGQMPPPRPDGSWP